MGKKIIEGLKGAIGPFIVGSILFVIGYFGDFFIWLGIGVIIITFSLIGLSTKILSKQSDSDILYNVGCLGILILIPFVLLSWFFEDQRYITKTGSKQHLYADCSTIKRRENVKEVTKMEGFFHLTFADCKICKKREAEEEERKNEEWKQKMREEKIQELKEKIYKYKCQIKALRNGADVFDIEDDYDDPGYDEEEEDFRKHIPSRYW